MTASENLFDALSVIFPNRIRAQFENQMLIGLAGPYDLTSLELIGEQITYNRPEHNHFVHRANGVSWIAADRQIITVPNHPDIVVRYLHFSHDEDQVCRVLALATGPANLIDQIEPKQSDPMPITRREFRLGIALAAGRSLRAIATVEGTSINTIRNQLKSAMRATNTHSQSHFISIVRDWLL